MQPSSREMDQELLSNHFQIHPSNFLHTSHFDPSSSHDDFLDQMFFTIPSSAWSDLNSAITGCSSKHRDFSDETPLQNPENSGYTHDESAKLALKLRNHQISGSSPAFKAATTMLQQHFLMSKGVAVAGDDNSSGLLPMPLSMESPIDEVADGLSAFKSHNPGGDQALYNGFAAHKLNHPQHIQPPQSQNHGASGSAINQLPSGSSTGAAAAQPRQRVRARRGQATDPHSIAERLRRERIAERMKALQELVPNTNKSDKASMLEEIIDYVKFLQLQVKVLSMSRLGGMAAVAPLVAGVSSEGRGDGASDDGNGGPPDCPGGAQTTPGNDGLAATEQQVARMIEEDIGSAMQYLQGKGLCLMPISLATAISTTTCRSSIRVLSNVEESYNPNMSALTVQSATMVNGISDLTVKTPLPFQIHRTTGAGCRLHY